MTDDIIDKIRGAQDQGLNPTALPLRDVFMVSAQTGPIIMLPCMPGEPEKPLGYGFIAANLKPETALALSKAVDEVLIEHGVVTKSKDDAFVTVEGGGMRGED